MVTPPYLHRDLQKVVPLQVVRNATPTLPLHPTPCSQVRSRTCNRQLT